MTSYIQVWLNRRDAKSLAKLIRDHGKEYLQLIPHDIDRKLREDAEQDKRIAAKRAPLRKVTGRRRGNAGDIEYEMLECGHERLMKHRRQQKRSVRGSTANRSPRISGGFLHLTAQLECPVARAEQIKGRSERTLQKMSPDMIITSCSAMP
jgi:hypothetical protein